MDGFPTDSLPSPDYTSFRVSMTQEGLNEYVNFALRGFVAEYLGEILIGDIAGYSDFGIANVSYSLTEIELSTWYIDEFGVSLQEDQLQNAVFISDAGLSLNFNWQYAEDTWPYIGDEGWGTAEINGMEGYAYISMNLSETCAGHLSANCSHMDLDLGDIDINLHGGASWLYDLIISVLLDTIEDTLNDQLSSLLGPAITTAVNELVTSFAILKPSPLPDSDGSGLDYRFLSAPRFHDLAIMVDMHGQDYGPEDTGRDWVWPETVEMPDILTEDAIQYFIGLPTFNSWYYVHHDLLNAFTGTVDYTDLPEAYQPFLTTGVLSAYAPGLADYPPDTQLSLRIASSATPRATIYPAAVYVGWEGTVEVSTSASSTTSSAEVLFTLDAKLGTSGPLSWWTDTEGPFCENFTLFYVETDYYNSSVSLFSSNVGDVDVSGDMSMLFGLLASDAVCPFLHGISYDQAMSTPNTDFIDVESFYSVNYDDYILWAANILSL